MQRHIDLGGHGPLIHLAPANGFPPEVYQPLADQLAASFQVVGYRPRPLWPDSGPEQLSTWQSLSNDMLYDMASLGNTPMIGIGHSLGGNMSLYAALRQPGRFRGLVLMESVFLPRTILFLGWLAKQIGKSDRIPLAAGAARRRDSFADIEEARKRYHGRGIFANFVPASFDAYLTHGLRADDQGGVTLSWPKRWERHIFSLTPFEAWDALVKLEIPLLLIRGTQSDVLIERSWKRLHRLLPHAQLVELNGSHLLPMEQPEQIAATIREWAENL